MAHDKLGEGPGRPARVTGKITLSMDDLKASLDSFAVEGPVAEMRGRVVAAEDTFDIDCTEGATCNFKCGDTAYWECGITSFEYGCDTLANTCYSCGINCPTYGCTVYAPTCPAYDPFC